VELQFLDAKIIYALPEYLRFGVRLNPTAALGIGDDDAEVRSAFLW
jgi:hypothetical protein